MPLGVLWQQLVLPRIATDGVLWGPHGTLPFALRVPAVVTLHDFTSLTAPGRHRLKTIASFNLFIGRSLEKAARIAAVSRTVADEAMRWFGVLITAHGGRRSRTPTSSVRKNPPMIPRHSFQK